MNRDAGLLVEQVGEYASCFDRVSAHLDDESSAWTPIRLASDAELLAAVEANAKLQRLAATEAARLAGEVAYRSRIPDDSSLAKRMGATSAVALVAARSFTTKAAAGTLVRLGEATRPDEALTGQALPPKHPHIAAALAAGTLPAALAAAMLTCLHKVRRVLTAGELDELEAQLVAAIGEGWTLEELTAWLKKVVELVDPDRAGEREDDLRAIAKVTEVALESGLTRFILDLDPETAGLFKTAMDAGTSLRRPAFLDAEPEDDDSVSEADAAAEQADRRPQKARRVDGVRLMATRALKMDDGHVGGTAVTMLVTIPLADLIAGTGSGCIDGIESQISAATARLLAVDAEIIPVVLGGNSRPLDTGTGRRFFTEAQRRAMAVRDGGCVGPACRAPVSACEGAHIVPAGRGPTSTDNGVLLCWRCHRLMDLHGWQISRKNGRWWWTPPPWIDPTGRLRPGGTPPDPEFRAGPFHHR